MFVGARSPSERLQHVAPARFRRVEKLTAALQRDAAECVIAEFDGNRAMTRVPVLATARLVLREMDGADAPFILELQSEPAWLRFVGDKGVRNVEDARRYIETGPRASYAKNGFGLWLVESQDDGLPLGICGLIQRDSLPDVDIGFAFSERSWGQGFAHEAAAAVLAYGRDVLGIGRIVAITDPNNRASIRVLEKIGLRIERTWRGPADDAELLLFAPGG